MPLQNRVTPQGELIAHPARGLVFGNRGCLHDAERRVRRRYAGRRWIACRLEFRGWRRPAPMQPGRYTELFFLDDATALAAGHRPCALCRRADYDRFLDAWRGLYPEHRTAESIDEQLHAERIDRSTGGHRLHRALADEVADGAFVLHDGAPHLVLGLKLMRWRPDGYTAVAPRPTGVEVELVTPPSIMAVLAGGWAPLVPFVHPSAAAR